MATEIRINISDVSPAEIPQALLDALTDVMDSDEFDGLGRYYEIYTAEN